MRYELTYTHRAATDIQALDARTGQRIGKALQRYTEDPLRYAEKLTDPRLGTYRFRIGSYRVIFDLEGNKIVALRAGRRSSIYRG